MSDELELTQEEERLMALMRTAAKEAAQEAVKESGLLEVKGAKPGATDSDAKVIKDEADQPFSTFGEQLQAVLRAGTIREVDPRLRSKVVDAMGKATGMSEGVPSEGGFLVQQEFVNVLLERMYQTGILASKCYRHPVGGPFNGVKLPRVDESSRVDGSRWGGIRAYWESEGGTKTPSKPAFGQTSLELKKLIGLCYVTDELLQDAVGLEAYVNRWFPLEFGFKMDDAIVNGDGSGKPLGILNGPCLVTPNKESGQAAATIVAENIVKMWARMWAASRANAIWLINQDIEPQLFTMSLAVGTGGVPIYMPANGLAGSPYGTLMGRPVMPIEQCQTLGTAGDIILADLSQYILIEKGGIQAASSIHVQFTTDETAFRFVYRVNGQPMWSSALTPFKGSNTLSPFVNLQTR